MKYEEYLEKTISKNKVTLAMLKLKLNLINDEKQVFKVTPVDTSTLGRKIKVDVKVNGNIITFKKLTHEKIEFEIPYGTTHFLYKVYEYTLPSSLNLVIPLKLDNGKLYAYIGDWVDYNSKYYFKSDEIASLDDIINNKIPDNVVNIAYHLSDWLDKTELDISYTHKQIIDIIVENILSHEFIKHILNPSDLYNLRNIAKSLNFNDLVILIDNWLSKDIIDKFMEQYEANKS